MKRTIIMSAILFVLLVTAVLPAQVNIQLLVEEHNGLARTGEVISSGVPFAVGTLAEVDLANLRVEDSLGNVVPAQFQILNRWWQPRYDNSIRWLLVTFPASAPASGTATYYLRTGSNIAPARPVNITTAPGLTTIDTGAIKAVLNGNNFQLFDAVWIDANGNSQYEENEKVVQAAGSDGLVLTSGDWSDLGLVAGQEFRSSAGQAAVTVEESGPIRAVVCISGTLQREGLPAVTPYYEYAVRLYFYAGESIVRCHVTLRNNRVANKKAYVWPIEDFTVRTSLSLGQTKQYALLGQTTPVRGQVSPDGVKLYQDSSGTDNWQTLPAGTYEKWLCPWTNGATVRGVTFRGYQVFDGSGSLEQNNYAKGWIDVHDGVLGCAAGVKDFWQQYPKALRATTERIEVSLLPGEWSEVFSLTQGSRKRHEIVYDFHAGTLTDQQLNDRFAQVDRPLRFRCPASVYIDSDAWDGGLGNAPKQTASTYSKTATTGATIGVSYGWDWYGWMTGWNAAGSHDNEASMFMSYVLWGDWRAFERAEIRTLWAELSASTMFDQPIDMTNHWHYLYAWPNIGSTGVTEVHYPAWYNRAVWGRADSGHCGMFQNLEYYYLTGDRHVLEDVLYYGQYAKWVYHPHFHLGKKYQYSSYNGNPDDPSYMYGSRYWGWPLWNLAQAYAATGDAAWLADASLALKGVRNTLRQSPLKFASEGIYNAGSNLDYYSNWLPAVRATAASQGYALFQMGITARGAATYYQETGDDDAMDVLVGFGDFVTEVGANRDATGKFIGWPYCWGDYWGFSDAATGVHLDVASALGWAWQFARKAVYTRDLQTIYTTAGKIAAANWTYDGYYLRANCNPPTDLTPPAAVSDLRARGRADGSILVRWTAPGNDGSAGTTDRYQLKYSTSPIVETVTGWPDMTTPLPQTAAEWQSRAAALKASQLPFVSAWNVQGEPAPDPAGIMQSMVLSLPQAGQTSYLAIKSLDAANNLSDLSNVAGIVPGQYKPGDINNDNYVNVGDLQWLVACWGTQTGQPGYDPLSDLTDDGYINVGDLQVLVAGWNS